jgi:ferredoxin
MIDGGTELEPANARKLVELSGLAPDTWTGAPGNWLRENMQSSVEGIPLKLAYGSDFPYRSLPGAPRVEGTGVNTKFSLAKGGLSLVWGAAVMPYRQHDLTGWPISSDDLAPHYRAVLDFMPVAQGDDALAREFPTFHPTEPMPLSPQAAALHARLQSNAAALTNSGVTFGRSRLAVNLPGIDAPGPCVRCGLCMYGCPYSLIYTTAQTVDRLRAHPNFQYLPGHVVQYVQESVSGVRVHTLNSSGLPEHFDGERAFLGAGVLSTAALMLRSLDAYDAPVTLQESHYFLLPMLRLASVPGFQRGDLHTLAQLFVEILDRELSPYTIHLQTYTYNDLFEAPIAEKLGPAARVFPWNAFLSRLFLFQGYLHSDHSPLTDARLKRRGETRTLHLTPTERPEATEILKNLVRKLTGLRGQTGMIPLSPLMRRGEPGRGFHTGSSFPMSASPTGFQSDTLGRPAGLQRVHLVDSSVLPSIPATTITFTVMANAHRIGTLAGTL